MTIRCPFAFRILGNPKEPRRLVDAAAVFLGYAASDPQAEVDREAYISAFSYGPAFRELLDLTGSPRGYDGDCHASWLWFDIDRENDLERALTDARRLAASAVEGFRLDGDDLLLFYS